MGLLIDGASETVKHKTKKQKGWFLSAIMAPVAASLIAPMASSLIQPIASSLTNSITGKGRKGEFLLLLALPLMMKLLGNGVTRTGRGYMDKKVYFCSIL